MPQPNSKWIKKYCYFCGAPSIRTILIGEDDLELCDHRECILAYCKKFNLTVEQTMELVRYARDED